jgi:hypothetical protein
MRPFFLACCLAHCIVIVIIIAVDNETSRRKRLIPNPDHEVTVTDEHRACQSAGLHSKRSMQLRLSRNRISDETRFNFLSLHGDPSHHHREHSP